MTGSGRDFQQGKESRSIPKRYQIERQKAIPKIQRLAQEKKGRRLVEERFHRVQGYREIPQLVDAIHHCRRETCTGDR